METMDDFNRVTLIDFGLAYKLTENLVEKENKKIGNYFFSQKNFKPTMVHRFLHLVMLIVVVDPLIVAILKF